MSLAQIGEFSFIIAVLGASLGAARDFLYPVTVAVSALTTLTTPWLIRASEPSANFVDHRLPRPLQTFAALYGAWLEELRRPSPVAATAQRSRLVRLLVLDTLALAALIVLAASLLERGVDALVAQFASPPGLARAILIAFACLGVTPLVVGIGRVARRLGSALAGSALPRIGAGADLDAAPRRALELTLQFGTAVGAGIVVLAITQPFLPALSAPIALLALFSALGVAVWRGATNLESHVRAGSQAVLETLASYAKAGRGAPAAQPIDEIRGLLHGLGEPVALRLGAGTPALGRSLAELNLRGLTGATVLAIARGSESIVTPGAGEILREGDVLAVAGTSDAVAAARVVLCG
jgi:CPA2 family monovalent cation:H+ antiporter-2